MRAHSKIGTDSMKRLFTHRSSFQLAITAHPHSVTCNRIAPDDKDVFSLVKIHIYHSNYFYYGSNKLLNIIILYLG